MAVKLLLAYRERCYERYGGELSEQEISQRFENAFLDEAAFEAWLQLDASGRASRIRAFERALSQGPPLSSAFSEDFERPAVNDDDFSPMQPRKSVEGFIIEPSRPTSRSQCPGYRPCPYVSCRYHLFLDVTRRGRLRLKYPETEIIDLEESCSSTSQNKDPEP